jgi:hypothetical protein
MRQMIQCCCWIVRRLRLKIKNEKPPHPQHGGYRTVALPTSALLVHIQKSLISDHKPEAGIFMGKSPTPFSKVDSKQVGRKVKQITASRSSVMHLDHVHRRLFVLVTPINQVAFCGFMRHNSTPRGTCTPLRQLV